jgi:hypothetical protein
MTPGFGSLDDCSFTSPGVLTEMALTQGRPGLVFALNKRPVDLYRDSLRYLLIKFFLNKIYNSTNISLARKI